MELVNPFEQVRGEASEIDRMVTVANRKAKRAGMRGGFRSYRDRQKLATAELHNPRHRTGTSKHFWQWTINHANRLVRQDTERRNRREARQVGAE